MSDKYKPDPFKKPDVPEDFPDYLDDSDEDD